MELLALASTKEFLEARKAYFQKQGWAFVPFQDIQQLRQFPGIVIFIPIECQGQLVSPVETWRLFLANHYPACRLAITGVEELKHHNYLDLLALPEDLSAFLGTLIAVDDADWQPFGSEAMDMQDKLWRFFEGHGDESVTYSLSKITRKMETLAKKLKEAPYRQAWKEIFEPLEGETVAYTESKWKELRRRWEHYAPFFQYLPFKETMESVGQRLAGLSPFFENNCLDERLYDTLKCKENLNWVYTTLDTIKKEYVPKKLQGPGSR